LNRRDAEDAEIFGGEQDRLTNLSSFLSVSSDIRAVYPSLNPSPHAERDLKTVPTTRKIS